jgi:thymidylate kinase
MHTTASRFLDLFFRKLEELGIPYVIIHSYRHLPDEIGGDIDYAVPDERLGEMTAIQEELGRHHHWRVVQSFRHGVFAYYNVLVSLDDPSQILQLDACSHYARACRMLVENRILLENRRRFRNYWVPQPAAEFIYEVTKLFDAKMKDPAAYLPKLRATWEQDKEGAQSLFLRAFGDTGMTLEEWFARPAEDWLQLRARMLARNRFGLRMLTREAFRVLSRLLRPTGLQVSLLGPDGSGKTTLIEMMNSRLAPLFRRSKVFHFRPSLPGSNTAGAPVTDPHGKTPFGFLKSVGKLGYYFATYWAAYFLLLIKLRATSTLVIFDRDFTDMVVDPKRYRLSASSTRFVRMLTFVVPGSDLTLVLDVDPVVCHARKPELPVAELKRQRERLRDLAANKSSYSLIDANRKPDQVADQVCQRVIEALVARRSCF